MRKLLVLALLVAVALLLAAAPAFASPPEPFLLYKVFPSPTHPDDNACDITQCTLSQFEGATIFYLDRTTVHGTKEIARVEIRTQADELLAVGQVRWLGEYGLFTFKGSEAMRGFHATGRVDYIAEDDVFLLTGTYHWDPKQE